MSERLLCRERLLCVRKWIIGQLLMEQPRGPRRFSYSDREIVAQAYLKINEISAAGDSELAYWRGGALGGALAGVGALACATYNHPLASACTSSYLLYTTENAGSW